MTDVPVIKGESGHRHAHRATGVKLPQATDLPEARREA